MKASVLLFLLSCFVYIAVADFIYSPTHHTYDPSVLEYYGTARPSDDRRSVIVVDSRSNVEGSAWYEVPQDVTKGFEIEFSIAMYKSGASPVGNGIAFVINANPSLVGSSGLGTSEIDIAYDIKNTVALEIDVTYNQERHDIQEIHAGFQSCGAYSLNSGDHRSICSLIPQPIPLNSIITSIDSTFQPQLFHCFYNHTRKSFTAYLDGHLLFSTYLDLASQLNLIGGTSAYLGFTSATGDFTGRFDWLTMNYAELTQITEIKPSAVLYPGQEVAALGFNFKNTPDLCVFINNVHVPAEYVSEVEMYFTVPEDMVLGDASVVVSNDGVFHSFFVGFHITVNELASDEAPPASERHYTRQQIILICVPTVLGFAAMAAGIGIFFAVRRAERKIKHVPLDEVKSDKAKLHVQDDEEEVDN